MDWRNLLLWGNLQVQQPMVQPVLLSQFRPDLIFGTDKWMGRGSSDLVQSKLEVVHTDLHFRCRYFMRKK
jgi:hypothetical protein